MTSMGDSRPQVASLAREFRALNAEARELRRRADERWKEAEAIADRMLEMKALLDAEEACQLTVDSVDALLADSIVSGEDHVALTPYVKKPDGRWWYGQLGMTGKELVDQGGTLRILSVGDRPILADLSQIEQVRVMASYHGWRSHDTIGVGAAKFDMNDQTYIALRYSAKTGKLTQPPVLSDPDGGSFAPTTNKLWYVLRWLEEKGVYDTDD